MPVARAVQAYVNERFPRSELLFLGALTECMLDAEAEASPRCHFAVVHERAGGRIRRQTHQALL